MNMAPRPFGRFTPISEFADILGLVPRAFAPGADCRFPPYNMEQTGPDSFELTLALAGYPADRIVAEVRAGELVISASKPEATGERQFLHRGIAERSFEASFRLANHLKVGAATFQDGLLRIQLTREIPEAEKPRTIKIG